MCLQDPVQRYQKVYIREMGRSFGFQLKEHQKEVELQEQQKYFRSTKTQSQSSTKNLRSQITSTQRIMSSTVTRGLSSAVSLTAQHGGSGRPSRSKMRVRGSWIEKRDLPDEPRLRLTGLPSDISWTAEVSLQVKKFATVIKQPLMLTECDLSPVKTVCVQTYVTVWTHEQWNNCACSLSSSWLWMTD